MCDPDLQTGSRRHRSHLTVGRVQDSRVREPNRAVPNLPPSIRSERDRPEIDADVQAESFAIAGRYGDLERRVLDYFIEQPGSSEVVLPGGLDLLLAYLVRDGLLRDTGKTRGVWITGIPAHKVYALTDQGHELIKRWREARELT